MALSSWRSLLPHVLGCMAWPACLAAVPAFAADAAQMAATVCATCHGVDGNSSDPKNPKIAGMDQEYLLRQLKGFASGQRRDETMAGIVANIDPGDFPLLAAHYGKQKPAAGKVGNKPFAEAGRKVYEDGNTDTGVPACAGCHQPDGAGNARFPRLAGQHPAYTLKQLADYKSGRRATDRLMVTVGQRLTAEEMKALAEFVAGLGQER